MEEFSYKILWIDDKHENFGGLKGRARRNGIIFYPFKSLNGGLGELERNFSFYDGVLLDAKIFENEDDLPDTEHTKFVHRAKERLLQLPKKFEPIVFSAQSEKAYENPTFLEAFPKTFKKGSDDEVMRLFEELKNCAYQQIDTQLRSEFPRVFSVCTERYIGEKAEIELLDLLKLKNFSELNGSLTAIRLIIEDLFKAFNVYQLLPIEFVNPDVAINETSKFLSGKNANREYFFEKGFKHLDETHLPGQISSYIRNILFVCQSASHRSKTDEYVKVIRTPYLFKSILYQLLDVLVWFKMYVDSNPKTQNWERIEMKSNPAEVAPEEVVFGKVFKMNLEKGFAFFKPNESGNNVFIPPHIVKNHSLLEGMEIQAEIEEYFDTRTNDQKTRVKNILKL